MEEKNMQIATVDFYKQSLTVIEKEGEKYVAMRPIVEGIGIDWASQYKKLIENTAKFNRCDITTVASDGKPREMLCIPIKKLNGYLFSINPEKVHKHIKDKVVLYQEECFAALFSHFTNGYSLNKRVLESSEEKREQLSEELRQLRIADKDLYKKLTDAISLTCTDYQSKTRKDLNTFFATIQDNFHFAVSGYTAAELVYNNVDHNQKNIGMISYIGDCSRITQADVRIGKNYLDKKSSRRFEILYDQLLSFIEMKVLNGDEMTLATWLHQLNSLIITNGLNPFPGYNSKITRIDANAKAKKELKLFKMLQLK